jgi:hypothetical protein
MEDALADYCTGTPVVFFKFLNNAASAARWRNAQGTRHAPALLPAIVPTNCFWRAEALQKDWHMPPLVREGHPPRT